MTPVGLVRLAIASVFLALLAPTWADPDLWGHLRFGADIVAGGIPARDPYAYTSAPTWMNQSWLADVLMALAYAAGGTPLLVAAKLAVACAIVGIVGWVLHRDGVGGPLFELLIFVCIAALYPSMPTVRPQVLSLLVFALLLERQTRRPTPDVATLAVVPLVMALWANVHGSWLLGLVELEAWLAAEIVTSREGARKRAQLAAIGVLAALSTLATPYGVGLWRQLAGTMGTSLRDVTEWRGLLETRAPAIAVWLALVGLGGYAAAKEGIRPSRLVVLAFLAFASWRVRRLLPFFGVATVTLLATSFAALGRRRPARDAASARPLRPALRWGLVAAVVVLVASNAWQVVHAFGCLRIDHTREADVQAARFLKANRLHGRLLAYSDWGVYAIWHLAPALRPSIDGRREFAYSLAEIARHDAIYWNAPTALADVDALAPDYIWLPAALPVVPVLGRAGWATIYATDRSVVLARSRDATYVDPPATALPACFPADPAS
jgi:hypothetical protein